MTGRGSPLILALHRTGAGMDIRELRYFVQIARIGSVSGARPRVSTSRNLLSAGS